MNGAQELVFEVVGPVAITIFLAATCIFLILRSSSRPRLFLLWAIGLHTLIMSGVGLILISNVLHTESVARSAAQRDLRFDLIMGTCMGAGVLVEAILIYLVCRLRANPRIMLPAPSISKSLLAALTGNAVSVGSFYFLSWLTDVLSPFICPSGLSG